MKNKVISINDVKRQTAGEKGDAERTMNILLARVIEAVRPGRGAEPLPYDTACEYRSVALMEDFLRGVVLEDDLGNCAGVFFETHLQDSNSFLPLVPHSFEVIIKIHVK